MDTENKYDDIINLPHHKSPGRQQMARIERAAQFAPFAALTGYDAAVRETARLTENKIELDEYEKEKINAGLQYIQSHIADRAEFKIIYYVPDDKKTGGAYISKIGVVVKIAEVERTVIFDDGTEVAIDNILSIDAVDL